MQQFGDPSHPTLLLVSGAAASMDWWDVEFCERLTGGGRHVVRYDHRDTGRSTTWPPGAPGYGADQLLSDCVDLIEVLGVGPLHLVGISMGGGIGQDIALRRSELLASLALLSTSAVGGVDRAGLPGPAPNVAASFESPVPDPDWSDVGSYAEWVLAGEHLFAGEIPLDETRLRAMAAAVHARSTDPAAASNHWLVIAADRDDEPLDVRRITTPTLVVHGSHDPLFPLPHGEALAAAIPGARLLVVPGMGHQVPPPDTWDMVIPALLEHTAGPAVV